MNGLFPSKCRLALLFTSAPLILALAGCGGSAGAASTNTQPASSPAPTATINANPTTISPGGSSTLSWQTQNATSASITPSPGGTVGLSGSATVTPSQTTTYTLVATGPGGTQQATATLTVAAPTPAAPTASLTVNPTSIQAGGSAALTWQTQNASSVTLDGAAVSATGTQTVSPSQTTTYTLIATGASGAQATSNATLTVTPAPPPPPSGINRVNHIIFMLQENRSFDHYFGQLGAYKAANGLGAASDVDGLPPNSTNLTDPYNGTRIPIASYHLRTACTENSDPDWLESHGDFNLDSPGSDVFKGDGYVHNGQGQAKYDGFIAEMPQNSTGTVQMTAAQLSYIYHGTTNLYLFASPTANPGNYSSLPVAVATVIVSSDKITKTTARPAITPAPGVTFSVSGGTPCPGYAPTDTSCTVVADNSTPFTINWSVPGAQATMVSNRFDQMGRRVMGYYDGNDLPYYYWMASVFGTSDRWFSPLPSNSIPNRVFTVAATTHGHAHDPGILDSDEVPPIFERLDDAGVSWKVYYTTDPEQPSVPHTIFNRFQPFAKNHQANLVPVSQYFTDLQNGTLPDVAFIEELPGYDEHPGATLPGNIYAGNSIQDGEHYMANIINSFMQSQYWNDGVFILTYDEAGGFYDHVAGQPAVSPDGIAPMDLRPDDIQDIVPQGDFTRTGFRTPLIVVSRFAKKSYVSHTVADHTAILKFIETRFGLPSLTARDAAQMDMTEFFNFDSPPWTTPPTPPAAALDLGCNYTLLQ
jgi:phospholipase C